MKHKLNLMGTKKGVASFYIIIFATMLFGVVTVSFTRIIISEVGQSSADDLSRSAYDSALAGVEDAKIYVNNYYRCLNANGGNASTCENPFAEGKSCDNGGFRLSILQGANGEEIKIQEGMYTADKTGDTSADQAYTCVIIDDVTPDYRGTLTADTRTKVIPIGVSGSSGTSNLGSVAKIRFAWYSQTNQGSTNNTFNYAPSGGSNPLFPAYNNATNPPTIQLTFLKTNGSIDLNDFHKENNTSAGNNSIINSTMVFLPSGDGTAPYVVSSADLLSAGNAYSSDAVGGTNTHNPYGVLCSTTNEFACAVELQVNGLMKDGDNAFLVVSLPYGDAFTDFAVTLYKADGTSINFKGVQVSVDSTGRTNNLFRRVETRLDPADLYFPYPQFALELDGAGGNSLIKNFWITANCWYAKGNLANDTATCNNNGNFSSP